MKGLTTDKIRKRIISNGHIFIILSDADVALVFNAWKPANVSSSHDVTSHYMKQFVNKLNYGFYTLVNTLNFFFLEVAYSQHRFEDFESIHNK